MRTDDCEITGINGNIIKVRVNRDVRQNEVAFAVSGGLRLKAEVIRIKGDIVELQVFESTQGLKKGDRVEFSGELLSIELGPGLLGSVFDGLQNPLTLLADRSGFFLERGTAVRALDEARKWHFTPHCTVGQPVMAGDVIGLVREGIFEHAVMVPFFYSGIHNVVTIAEPSEVTLDATAALIRDETGIEHRLTLSFRWPVKQPITAYRERLFPAAQLITRNRIIDTLFPVAKGGTYCIPGPFGAGKTVLQQLTSRHAKVDIVILAACGERANEVVETIREFPKLQDPYTGKSLMERTVIICNTSSMPVAARESSIYTAVTIAEYYRQMGLDVLLLADSTSRWAQAVRERSGRLEEIPGEEAFPAYLESLIAQFYERAGIVTLKNGKTGSVTIGGTISPAGGNFDEPVTRSTLKVVGAFHALSRERADARRFPAISPLESWSRYAGIIPEKIRKQTIAFLTRAAEIDQMMKVIGEEGTLLQDFILYLKGEIFDAVYLQQNAFDDVDAASSETRQTAFFSILSTVMDTAFRFGDREEARRVFNRLRQLFIDYNATPWDSDALAEQVARLMSLISEYGAPPPKEGGPHLRLALVEAGMDSSFRKPAGVVGYYPKEATSEKGAQKEPHEKNL